MPQVFEIDCVSGIRVFSSSGGHLPSCFGLEVIATPPILVLRRIHLRLGPLSDLVVLAASQERAESIIIIQTDPSRSQVDPLSH